jgi:WD40 repeat protein
MLEFSEPENREVEFAFWLEHAQKDDPLILKTLIDRYAADMIWLLNGLFDLMVIHQEVQNNSLKFAAAVFQRASKQLDRFQGLDNVRNWLFMWAIDVVLNHRKKSRSARRASAQSNLPKFSIDLFDKENGTASRVDLHELSDQERLVFFLRYASNLKVLEIAQISGMRPKNVYKLLFDVRKNIGLIPRKGKTGDTSKDIHTRVQFDIDARLDGYFLKSALHDETLRTHSLYCPECEQYLEKRERFDEILVTASQKHWPKSDLNRAQIDTIYQQAFQMDGKVNPGFKYRRQLRDVILGSTILLIFIIAGRYFSSQDTEAGLPGFHLRQMATPTAAGIREVPIRRVLELDKVIYVSDEFGELMGAQTSKLNDNILEGDFTYIESYKSISTNCLSISPQDNLLATCSLIGRVNIWSVEDKSVKLSLRGHTMPITNVSFSPDGSRLAAGSHDGRVTLWDTGTGAQLAELTSNTGAVLSVDFSPDGENLSVGATGAAWIWELGSGKFQLVDYFKYPGEQVHDVAYSSDNKLVAHAVSDGSVWVRKISDGKLITRLAVHGDEMLSIAFSPKVTFLASGSKEGTVNLWRIDHSSQASPQFSRFLEINHSGWVNDLAFSPDEHLLAVAVHRSQLTVWHIPEGTLLTANYDSRWNQPNGVDFSSDGKFLATGSIMDGIQIWTDIRP